MGGFPIEIDHYITFEGKNSLNNISESEPKDIVNNVKKELKERNQDFLLAVFTYDGSKPKRADIDNILLYNLGINNLGCLKEFVLEKKIELGLKGCKYQFDFQKKNNETKKEPVVNISVHIDDKEYKRFDKSFDRTKYFYQKFREKVLSSGSPIKLEQNGCELHIDYIGNIEVKESTFLKPLIDGFVSSLHKFKTSSLLKDNKYGQLVHDFILKNEKDGDKYLIENTNGGNLLTAHNPPHFNPMDEMINKIVFNKIEGQEETITVRMFLD